MTRFRDDAGLTAKQIEVVQWLAHGKRHEEIAGLVRLSRSAVGSTIHQALNATGTNTSAALVAFAMRRGLVE